MILYTNDEAETVAALRIAEPGQTVLKPDFMSWARFRELSAAVSRDRATTEAAVSAINAEDALAAIEKRLRELGELPPAPEKIDRTPMPFWKPCTEAEADAELRMTTFGPLENYGLAEPPERVKILNDGAQLTNGSRDVSYGPPAVNLACSGELKEVFRKHMRRPLSHAELEAVDMVLTKLGRVATGAKPSRDTYVDGATYFAIAGEIALSLA